MGTDVPETGVLPDKNGEPLTIGEYRLFVDEMMNQPAWRAVADKEMDYADGRQLDNELLQKQRELGLPPAVENLITPTLLSVQGYEATIRTDWRVTADGETGGRDVADALNFKLNRAERQSRADKACSDAFRGQIACGIGWVEVTRNPNPFEFPYECGVIHRNAIHWDMKSYKYDLSDARWLIRRRWLLPERLAQFFPEYAGHFKAMGRGGCAGRVLSNGVRMPVWGFRAAIRRFPPMRGPGRISRGAIRARRMRADGRRRLWDLTGMCIGAASRCVILTRSVLWCLLSRMRCRLRSGSFIRGRLRLMRGP